MARSITTRHGFSKDGEQGCLSRKAWLETGNRIIFKPWENILQLFQSLENAWQASNVCGEF